MVNLKNSILEKGIADIKFKRNLMGIVIAYTNLVIPIWLLTIRLLEETSPLNLP